MLKRKILAFFLSAAVTVTMISVPLRGDLVSAAEPDTGTSVTETEAADEDTINNGDEQNPVEEKQEEGAVPQEQTQPEENQELLKGTEVKTVKLDEAKNAIVIEELNSQDEGPEEYLKKITQITVQGRPYTQGEVTADSAKYEFTEDGLVLGMAAVEAKTEVRIAADGYMDKLIQFAKADQTDGVDAFATFLAQKDVKPGGQWEDQVDPATKKTLKSRIKEAEVLQRDKQTWEVWLDLQDAIHQGTATVEDDRSTREEVDSAIKALESAIKNFKECTEEYDPSKITVPKKKGVYTVTCVTVNKKEDRSSMLRKTMDPKAKLEVDEQGNMKITMLNVAHGTFVVDFALENGKTFNSGVKSKVYLTKKKALNAYTFKIKDLAKEHRLAALISMMGGQISDIGKYDSEKYQKGTLIITSVTPEWEGFQKEIDKKKQSTGAKRLQEELMNYGLDRNHDGTVEPKEVSTYKDRKLELTGCGLTDIDLLRYLPNTVKILDLSNNEISKLPKGLLDNLTGLTDFYIENNEVEGIPTGFFRNNHKIKWISFHNNEISSLDDGDLTGLDNLGILDLEKNHIGKVGTKVFEGTSKLDELSFVDNEMHSLPNGIFKPLRNCLTKFYIHENYFRHLPKAMNDLHSLKRVDAYINSLVDIDGIDFSKMKHLQEVSLRHNDITHVNPGTFAKNKKLEALDLRDNQLKNFSPEVLPKLAYLRKLDLTLNNIKVVDPVLKRKYMKYGVTYPQKANAGFVAKAKSGNTLSWHQKIDTLVMKVWYDITDDAMMEKYNLATYDEFYEYMKNRKWTGDNFYTVYLEEKAYDWDIVTRLQKKDANGIFRTVKESRISDKKDQTAGTFKISEPGEYRVTKVLYSTNSAGAKTYNFTFMSDPVKMTGKNQSVKAPGKFTAKAMKKGKVKFSWKKVAGANGYILEFSKKKTGFKTLKKVTKSKSVVIKNRKLKKGQTYYFAIRAYKKQAGKTYFSKRVITKKIKIRR